MTQANGFEWPQGKTAAVSLSFDDARVSQLDVGIPILNANGVRATFYVIPRSMEPRLEDWKKAVKSGHELGNHTVSHPCSGNFRWARAQALEEYTLEGMAEEMRLASERIQELVGVTPRTFGYPCGQKFVGRGAGTLSTVSLVAERFLAGRGFRDECPNDPAYCDLAQLAGVEGDDLSFEQYLSWLNRARDERGWVVFAAHDVGAGGRQTVRAEALQQLCRYCTERSNGIWIDTIAAIARPIAEWQRTQMTPTQTTSAGRSP